MSNQVRVLSSIRMERAMVVTTVTNRPVQKRVNVVSINGKLVQVLRSPY